MRRIIRTLATDVEEDTAERVAAVTFGRPARLVRTTRRDNVAVRRTASQRLGKLLEAEIEFNPAGTPEERAKQLVRLGQRFGDDVASTGSVHTGAEERIAMSPKMAAATVGGPQVNSAASHVAQARNQSHHQLRLATPVGIERSRSLFNWPRLSA